jgi:hypothetical protein
VAAARLNAFMAGYLSPTKLSSELAKLDMPRTAFEQIMDIAAGSRIKTAH